MILAELLLAAFLVNLDTTPVNVAPPGQPVRPAALSAQPASAAEGASDADSDDAA
jgi:hypothetical protein